jgi:hypothetical protein
MYCSRCKRQLYYKDLCQLAWCDDCNAIVRASFCSVRYWVIGVICVMCLAVQLHV